MERKNLSFDLKSGYPISKKINFDMDINEMSISYSNLPIGVVLKISTYINGSLIDTFVNPVICELTGVFDSLELEVSSTIDFVFEFDINFSYKPITKSFAENDYSNLVNNREIGAVVRSMEEQMNLFVNINDGILVRYYRTKPILEDVVLKEYLGKAYFEDKCMNILTEDNRIPDLSEAQLTEFGSEYETIDAQIVPTYFESIFGVCEQPREGDWLVIMDTNTPFRVSSCVLERGINGGKHSWKITLSNFYDDDAIDDDGFADINTTSYEKEFGMEVENNIEDVVNDKQNISPQIYGDMNRVKIDKLVMYNSDTYNMIGGVEGGLAVTYKSSQNVVGGILFMVRSSENTILMDFGSKLILVEDFRLKIFGAIVNYVLEEYATYYVNIGFNQTNTFVQILDASYKEVYYYDSLDQRVIYNDCKLTFGDHEIGKVRLVKKPISRGLSRTAFSVKTLENSSDYHIIDDALEPNNNPRAKESQFRKQVD